MARTQHYGFNKFGAEGRISDEGYKFSLRDRDLIDAVLQSFSTHNHQAVSSNILDGPPTGIFLVPTLITNLGALQAGRDYYYKFSYLDANGNETAASSAILASTPDATVPPESQILATADTGGSLLAGTYKYALGFYQDAGGLTTAPNLSTIVVPTGTSTNTITIPLPLVPDGIDGWNIYRKGPGDLEYWLLISVADGPTEYVDDGSVNPDCTKRRPAANTTNSTNSVQLDLPVSELPLDTQVVSWRLYRTSSAGSYSANSLVATVVETTTEGGADLVTTFTDAGDPPSLGIPLDQTAVPQVPPTLDAGEIFKLTGKPLPSELAPRGGRSFNLLLPGVLAVQDYHQFSPPHDMFAERIDGFYLTAPTGLTPSTDFVTLRFSDDATQNAIQSLFNDAVTQDEIFALYNDASSGTFTLTDGTDTTLAIAFDAIPSVIETRLVTDITAIVDVTVVGSGTPIDPWVVTYVDPGATNVIELVANDGGLTGGSSTETTPVEGSDGGDFTLSDGTDTTAVIAYDASASTVETRLQTDITSITDVTVTGLGTQASPWVIEFINPGGQDVALLIFDDDNLNGISTIAETTEGFGITQVDLIIDQNQQAHNFQSSTTDEGTQEAEDAPAVGGVQVSDTLALNDVAMELASQNDNNFWQIGVLEAGRYDFRYWVSDVKRAAVFALRVNELTVETQSLHNNSSTGDFTITFQGETTAVIVWNAAASAVKAALELLSNIVQVSVTGIGTAGDPWKIDFDNPAGNVDEITTADGGMDGTSTIATDVAGTSTTLDSLSINQERPVYEPFFEITTVLDGTEIVQLEVEKTDVTINEVRVDKYEYEVRLDVLHGGSTVTVEVLVTGSPSTNGTDLQAVYWY